MICDTAQTQIAFDTLYY